MDEIAGHLRVAVQMHKTWQKSLLFSSHTRQPERQRLIAWKLNREEDIAPHMHAKREFARAGQLPVYNSKLVRREDSGLPDVSV